MYGKFPLTRGILRLNFVCSFSRHRKELFSLLRAKCLAVILNCSNISRKDENECIFLDFISQTARIGVGFGCRKR